MAIKVGLTGQNNGDSQVGQAGNEGVIEDNLKELSFGELGGFMSKQSAGVDEATFTNALSKVVEKSKHKCSFHIFSRTSFQSLAYANIIVTMEHNGVMAYFDVLLEGTGQGPISVSNYMNAVEAKEIAFVTTDAIDSELFKVILKHLRNENPNIKKFINMAGIVVNKDADLSDERVVRTVAAEAYNACWGGLSGKGNELDLTRALSSVNGYVKLKQITLTQPHISALGKQTKVDWCIEFSATNKVIPTSPNTVGSENAISTAYGRINFLPEEYTQQLNGMQQVQKTGFHPQIIISNFEFAAPTMGYTLISIATSAVMAKDYNWVRSVMANNEIDIGVLNKIVNIYNEEKGGKPINVNNPKLTQDEKVNTILELVNLTPLISLEATAFSDNAAVLATFTTAANGDVKAASEIINTLAYITNGAFPTNYPSNEIFATNPVITPEGVWIDKNGKKRTIDDIDTKYILSVGGVNAREIASDYIFSEMGLSGDTFTDRVAMLQKLGIDAELTGRKMKMTFSHKFIETVLSAFTACGFDPRFDSNGIVNKPTGLGFTSGLFDKASITSVNAFNPYVQNNGYQGYANPFTMGYGYSK